MTDKIKPSPAYLNALSAHVPKVEIIKGKYLHKTLDCHHCLRTINLNEEKMTDVNIATHLLIDAWKDIFDLAIIVSGDSGLHATLSTSKKLKIDLEKLLQIIRCFVKLL